MPREVNFAVGGRWAVTNVNPSLCHWRWRYTTLTYISVVLSSPLFYIDNNVVDVESCLAVVDGVDLFGFGFVLIWSEVFLSSQSDKKMGKTNNPCNKIHTILITLELMPLQHAKVLKGSTPTSTASRGGCEGKIA